MKQNTHDKGYVLLGVLIIATLALLVTAGMLDSSAVNARTRAVVNTQTDNYYEVEETLNKTVGWLQDNSKYILDAFTTANFAANFDLGAPTLGDNEGEHFSVPTMVKMKGTNDSVMLSNNDFFGEDAFPSLTHVDTGVSLDAVSSFQAADLGSANARVILVWARATSGAYEPIFRIDVTTGNNPDRGVHSFSYVFSTLQGGGATVGFYGKDALTFQSPNNDCYSYQWTHNGASWDKGAPRSNCPAGSDGPINVSSKINGTAASLSDPGLFLNPPGGNVSGTTCEGAACHGYTLPALSSWAGYCPAGGASLTVNGVTSLAPGCYDTITINNNKTLQMLNTGANYYIKYINFNGNNANVDFGTIPVNQKVTFFVEQFNNNLHLNGNKMVNSNNAPHQVEMNYLGSNPLTFNGTAAFQGNVIAPYATMNVLGNFTFNGGILAKQLDISGNARVNYDENLGTVSAPSDMQFALKKTSQRYR